MATLKQVQAEHAVWLKRNYAQQTADIPAAGMIEEAGELLHAVLAQERVKLCGEESRYPKEQQLLDMMDAVGDCFLYLVSYCNTYDADVSWYDAPMEDYPEYTLLQTAVGLCAEACQFFAMRDLGYGKLYVAALKRICNMQGLDFYWCVENAWKHVKARQK